MTEKLDQTLLMMDLVDKMRHEEQTVNKKISDILEETPVKEKLKEIYSKNGILVSDELLSKAFQAYKENRFSFKETEPSLLDKFFFLYIVRDKWLAPFFQITGTISVATVIALIGFHVFVTIPAKNALESSYESLMAQKGTYQSSVQTLRTDIKRAQEQLKAEVNFAQQDKKFKTSAIFVPKANQVLQELTASLGALDSLEQKAQQTEAFIVKTAKEPRAIEHAKQRIANFEKAKENTALPLQQKIQLMKFYGELKVLETKVASLEAQQNLVFPSFSKEIAAGISNFYTSLNSFDLTKSQTFYGLVKTSYEQSGLAVKYQKQLKELHAQTQGASEEVVKESSNQAKTIERKLTPSAIASVSPEISQYEAFLAYAMQEVVFEIANEQGVKTGVERTYSENGQAAQPRYYLIARAKNSQGQPLEFVFKDNETSKKTKSSLFGVEASKSQYEKTRQDKKQDGIVDEAILGVKSAGTLKIQPKLDIKENSYLAQW